jgi:polyisoprenyl-phosphate glycosyltransferase
MNDAPMKRGHAAGAIVADRPVDRPNPGQLKPSDPSLRLKLALVVPIFNDFESFVQICNEVDNLIVDWAVDLAIIGVDDGSLQSAESVRFDPPLVSIRQVRLIKLRSNLGHQRAIAIGLVEVADDPSFDAVLVADSDGEDRPADMGRLISHYRANPGSIVVARRLKRSEGLRFRMFYAIYKAMFHLFTGKVINFGNFLLLSRAASGRITNMPETWNHLAASVLRSRIPISPVGCHRGKRYAGTSSMSLLTLLIHGLSAVSVFSDFVFVRMLVVASTITVLALVTALTAVVIRLATNLAIPGWATIVVGISLVIVFQSLLFSMVASLTMLRDRSSVAFVPSAHSKMFIDARLTLFESPNAVRDTQ